jgi:hypothetical protein
MGDFWQQGDVLFEQIVEGDYDEKVISRLMKDKKISLRADHKNGIVARGEATGHAHRFDLHEDNVQFYIGYGIVYVDLPDGGTITHEEHKPIDLPPGTYKVRQVVEFDHLEEAPRVVAD